MGIELILLALLLLVIYFFPTIVAVAVGHHNSGAITALNLFLGWTFLGWVVAFVWSLTKPQAKP